MDQSTPKGFNFKTGKEPDRPYRADLAPIGPIRRFFGNRRSMGFPLKLKKVLYVSECGYKRPIWPGGRFLINRRPNAPTLKLGNYPTVLIGRKTFFLGNKRSDDFPLKVQKSALWGRLGLKTADQVRKELFDLSASEEFNFKTAKLPAWHYRPDLVPPWPIRRIFRKSAFG